MVTSLSTHVAEDALAILVGLGMKQREAQTLVAQVLSTGQHYPSAQELVRAAYKQVKKYQPSRPVQLAQSEEEGTSEAQPTYLTATIPRYMQVLHTALLMVVIAGVTLWALVAAILIVPTFLYPVMSWGPGRFWWNLGGVLLSNGWLSLPLLAILAVWCARPSFRRLIAHYAYIGMAWLFIEWLILMAAILGLMLLASLLKIV